MDGQGNVYFSGYGQQRDRRMECDKPAGDTAGRLGIEQSNGSGSGREGNVYFADSGNQSIKEWVLRAGWSLCWCLRA